jgi:hypothetical protein
MCAAPNTCDTLAAFYLTVTSQLVRLWEESRDTEQVGQCVPLIFTMFETFFAPASITKITLEMHAKQHVAFHVKCPLLLSDIIKNGMYQQILLQGWQYQIQ